MTKFEKTFEKVMRVLANMYIAYAVLYVFVIVPVVMIYAIVNKGVFHKIKSTVIRMMNLTVKMMFNK